MGAEAADLTADAPGRASPGLNMVPHVVIMRTHSYCQRIGEEDSAHARGGLSGNPVPRERTKRGWTPGMSAWSVMQAYGGVDSYTHRIHASRRVATGSVGVSVCGASGGSRKLRIFLSRGHVPGVSDPAYSVSDIMGQTSLSPEKREGV